MSLTGLSAAYLSPSQEQTAILLEVASEKVSVALKMIVCNFQPVIGSAALLQWVLY
jgi:hypothetical protein